MFAKRLEKGMSYVFMLCATISVVVVVLISLFLFQNGLPAMAKIGVFNFLFSTDWSPSNIPPSFGIFPMILGSIYISLGATLIGVPIGILTALFMAKLCPKQLYRFCKPAIDLLAGIPSVVYGFFGIVVLIPLVRNIFSFLPDGGNGSSILTASILLGIMILPTVIGLSEAAIRAVPKHYYEGALALGATRERALFTVVIPAAKSGIMAAVVLGIGRAIGETMAVIMVAGNQARMPDGILKGIRTLTANIAIEMGYSVGLHREALIATGVVLFVFILLINLTFYIIKRRIA